eukprot:scaffold7287_cov41-Cyclotella_meneghiniana.AAC.2
MTTSKTIISQPPDVTVIVGSGKTKQEFQCYGILLAAASPVLDAMLSSGMAESENKRIEFPDKDPAVWELLLRCIDTERAFLNNFTVTKDYDSDDDSDNEDAVWGHNEARSELLELLSFSVKYGLEVTRKYVQRQIELALERFCWGSGDQADFNVHTVEEIVDICRPFKLRDEDDEVIYKGTSSSSTTEPSTKKQRPNETVDKGIYQSCNCENLWAQICSCIQEDLSVLHLEEINNGKLFSRMVYHELQQYHTSMESELKQKAASLIGEKKCAIIIDNDSIRKRFVSVYDRENENATMELIHAAIGEAVKRLVPFNAGSGNFGRIYQLNSDEMQLRMVFKPNLCSDNMDAKAFDYDSSDGLHYFFKPPNSFSDLRYSKPDLTVVVGQGIKVKEFQCHKVVLSFASAKLDSLVGKSRRRLFLPNSNPDGWQQFYMCIHPSRNGCALNEKNAETLAPMFPLFAEFEMHKNGFENLQQKVEDTLTSLFDDNHYLWICGGENDVISEGLYSYIEEKLKIVNFNRVVASEIDMFSNLVFHLLLNEEKERQERQRRLLRQRGRLLRRRRHN